MKYLLVYSLASFFISTSLFAQSMSIVGPCQETPEYEFSDSFQAGRNVGDFSIHALQELGLAFEGNERGINSINHSATGMDALEIISDSEMRAYGWCYLINGVAPEVFPDEILLTGPEDHIEWFFAYAYYKEGVWLEQCQPAYKIKPSRFCSNSSL